MNESLPWEDDGEYPADVELDFNDEYTLDLWEPEDDDLESDDDY